METSKITAYLDENNKLCIGKNTSSFTFNLKNTNNFFHHLVKNNNKFKCANNLIDLIHSKPLKKTAIQKIQNTVVEHPYLIPLLPEQFLTNDFILSAIKRNPRAIEHLPKQFLTNDFILSAIKINPRAIDYLPKQFLTNDFILRAIEINPSAINYLTLDQKKHIIKMAPIAAAQCTHLIADLIHTGKLQEIIKDTKNTTFILLAERTIRGFNYYGYPGIGRLPSEKIPQYLLSPKKPPDSLLHYANDTLRKNHDFVIDMGIVNPAALYYAHPELTQDPKFIQKAFKLDSLMVPKHAFVYADPSIDISQSKKIWSFLKQTGALDKTNRNRLCISVVRKLLTSSDKNIQSIPNTLDKDKIMKALTFLYKEFNTPQLISKHLYNTPYLEFMLELVRRNPQALRHADPDLAQNNWFLDHLNRHIPHQTISKGAFISPTVELWQSNAIYNDLSKKKDNKTPSILDRTGRILHKPDKASLKKNYDFDDASVDHIFNVLTNAYTAKPAAQNDTLPWVISTHASDEFRDNLPTIAI